MTDASDERVPAGTPANPVDSHLLLAEWTAEHMRNQDGKDQPEEWTAQLLGQHLVVRKHQSQPGYVWLVGTDNVPSGPASTIAGAKLRAERDAAHRALTPHMSRRCAVCGGPLLPVKLARDVQVQNGVLYPDNLWALDGLATLGRGWACRRTCTDAQPLSPADHGEWEAAWDFQTERLRGKPKRSLSESDVSDVVELVVSRSKAPEAANE